MSENEKTLDELPTAEYEGTVHPSDLHTDGDNPNEMTDEQFGLLCDRMRQNGWLGGPVVTDTDGLIADGEHRWRAAQEIGLGEVPVKQYDIDDGKRRLWRQELNKIHGEHDSKRDALEYDQLLSEGYSQQVNELVDAAGEDLDELLKEIRVDNARPADYEYNPEHNVYFEDCVEGMKERLDDDSVDMVFTSPPYNIGKEASQSRTADTEEYSDNKPFEEYKQLLVDVFSELSRVVKEDGHIFVNYGVALDNAASVPAETKWLPELFPNSTNFASHIIWHKEASIPSHSLHHPQNGMFIHDWESIFHFTNSNPRRINGDHRSVWTVPTVNGASKERGDTGEHPAPFPMDLVKKAMDASTDEGDVILDPFMGSGTTAVAAIQNNRDYVGFELDEEGAYKPIIERRISEAQRQMESEVNQEARADD